MSFFRSIRGLEPLTEAEQTRQDEFRREETAASWWEEHYNREGESGDNVAHVENHELWLEATKMFSVSRQGMINGYVRAFNRIPYWLSDDDYIGE